MESLLVDLRYALRALRRSPGFAAVAIATMALGIGANAAMFSFVDAVVLRTLPFREPGRLVEVWETFERDDLELRNVGYPTFLDWRARNSSFEDIGATTPSAFALTEVGEAQRIPGELADPQYFEILGVTPLHGRVFNESENEAYEQAPVAVLGHALWQSTFGGDLAILGDSIQLNGTSATVIGIMLPEFTGIGGAAQVWLPILPGARWHSSGVHP